MIKRYEVVRDDGDMSVGLGYSYAYYQLYTDTGTIINYDRDFTKVYEDVTGTENVWTLEDIKAIKEDFRGGRRNILYVKEIPLLDVMAFTSYLEEGGFTIHNAIYSGGTIAISGVESSWYSTVPDHEPVVVRFHVTIDIDPFKTDVKVVCDYPDMVKYIHDYFAPKGAK
jgi:hypothetical protein